jgi:tetraacyldisaccharide 4'-kinase
MGGAGKTPVVISIAQMLKNYSKARVAILTRGYKGMLEGPIMVRGEHGVLDVGDEALLLAKVAPTCVAKDRIKGIKFLESNYDIIITDDGMQDARFNRSLTIMVVDSYFGFGNGLIFPAGPLRESLATGVNKAKFIALIGEGDLDLPDNLPLFKANLVSKRLLQQQKFIAFAGIGNPEKFFHSVAESEGDVIMKLSFADHYQYSKKDMLDLIALAEKNQAKLITTEKDYTRIDVEFKDKIEVLPVSLIWEKDEVILHELLSL